MAKNYHYQNEGVQSRNKKDLIKIPITQAGETSTETRFVFQSILNVVELKTMDDSIQGGRLADAIDEAEGKDEIVIGEGVYDWLKEKLKAKDREGYEILPRIFRVNGSIVDEFIKNGYEKAKQPSKSKQKAGSEKTPDDKETTEGGPEEG